MKRKENRRKGVKKKKLSSPEEEKNELSQAHDNLTNN